MTEYWVSQGNKWCDFCKIYIANNPLSIRTHELGKRHKDNVAKRLATMKKESAAKEKEQKGAARALQQIEAKAKRSYQKDLASFEEAKNSRNHALDSSGPPNDVKCSATGKDDWELDAASECYYNQANGYHYDPNSGLYYSSTLGKWMTQEEARSSSKVFRPFSHGKTLAPSSSSAASKCKGGPLPGLVAPASSLNPMRSVKGAPSSIAVNKRKRESEKTKAISEEEEAALKAREAAKKRVEEREKPMLGLYRSY